MTQERHMPRLSRRRFLAFVGGATASAMLAACGGGSKATPTTAPAQTSASPTAAAAGQTPTAAATPTKAAVATTGKEFHGAWPYLVPPNGHFNLLDGVTKGILAGGIYHDVVLSPMAMYYWKQKQWLPLLAEKWSFDPSANTFTVTLKTGLKWSDGSSLTSKDVATTLWCVRALRNVVWKYIDTVETPDERTVRVHMNNPSTVVERYMLKLHIVADKQYGSLAKQVQDLFNSGKNMDAPEGQQVLNAITNFRPDQILASGPFQFDYKSITNAQLTLVKNPNGVNADKVLFDKLVIFNGETPDVTPVVLSKQVDYATHGFPPATEKAFQQAGIRIIRPPVYSGPALLFNLDKLPEFKDKRARQAIAHAIDRNQNGTVALGDSGKAVKYMAGFSDIMVPDWLGQDTLSKLNTYPYDTSKAEQLLTAAGWKKNGNTWQTPDGKNAEYELLFPAEYADWSAAAQNAAEQLTKFGIKVTPRSITYSQQPIEVDKGNFQLAIQAWGSSTNPHPHFSFVQDLFTHNIPIAANQGGKGMAFELKQQTDVLGQVDLEQLVVQAGQGLDEAKQKDAVAKVALAFNELVPMVPLWERYGNNPVIEGVRVQPWPADSDPIYLNAPYGDNFCVMMLLTGTLKPV
ncbi:ABC transporter substrate-binding protein [Thermorudis peleae]|uniref:ABC transporter substrate-binding protein n=1 Tax=Thermorudis peleae TaxID=1382356 RepID=UPI000570C4AD|nr:ABC transporter substrate-binding protein [Thermorudis peleae]